MYHNTSYFHKLYPLLLNWNLCQKMVKQTKIFRIIYMILFFLKRLVLGILAFLVFLTLSSNPLTQKICLDLYKFLFPTPWPGDFLKAISCGSHRACLVCFLSLRDHRPSLPNAKCLKNCCFVCILSGILLVSGGRVNPASITPSCPEAEVRKEMQRFMG